MKNLKQLFFGAAIALTSLTVVITSCTKDECEDVVCLNNGTCDSGVCLCPTGYQGTTCENQSIDKYLKIWNATDQEDGGSTANLSYPAQISQKFSDNIFQVEIANFSDGYFTNKVGAAVEGDQLVIPQQEPDNDGYQVEGTFVYLNGNLNVEYTLTQLSTGNAKHYTGTWN